MTKADKIRALKALNRVREEDLKTPLHKHQEMVLSDFYKNNLDTLFLACGRKYGKTFLALYILYRQALLVPNSACYYVCPELSHGKKLIWDTRRLHNFLGDDSEYFMGGKPNNRDLMIRLKNGSFIQILGSENYEAANGLSPHLIVYDEFKAFHPSFHRTMGPNRGTHGAKLVIIGTLADYQARNYDEYYAYKKFCEKDKNSKHYEATTWDNPLNFRPHIKRAIEADIAVLRAKGEEEVVQREYYSKIIAGGSRAIFPMFTEKRFVTPHNEIMGKIENDINHLEWHQILDPGTTTCYAGMFMAVHPKTKKVYIVDEIYETDQKSTSTTRIFPKVLEVATAIRGNTDMQDDWYLTCDEAAQWAMNEILDHYDINYMPTNKNLNKKENGISLIKDIMLHDLLVISDSCVNLIDELYKYTKDDKGNIPKKDDHLIDCFRYGLAASNYNLLEALEAKKVVTDYDEMVEGRFRSPGYDLYYDDDDLNFGY